MNNSTVKYVIKRVLLALMTAFIIMFISFVLIKLLEPEVPMLGAEAKNELARREALGYNKPIIVQFGIYLRNIVTRWDWGTSWNISYMQPVTGLIVSKLPLTVILNIYSTLFSLPIGITLGVIAALKKNKWTDHIISTIVMLFVSVPSFVYAFILQYTVGFRMGLLPIIVASRYDAGGFWTYEMFKSMIMPILALSFGSIAGYARLTRAELVESLTSDYMLLARTKGLTKTQATIKHALKNAMVPIFPSIIGSFLSVLGGSMVIEKIFSVNGIGGLFLQAVNLRDYDVFTATTMFYTVIGLLANIIVDLSYGFLDPRIRIGER